MFLEICYGLYPYSLEVSSVKSYKNDKKLLLIFYLVVQRKAKYY